MILIQVQGMDAQITACLKLAGHVSTLDFKHFVLEFVEMD